MHKVRIQLEQGYFVMHLRQFHIEFQVWVSLVTVFFLRMEYSCFGVCSSQRMIMSVPSHFEACNHHPELLDSPMCPLLSFQPH